MIGEEIDDKIREMIAGFSTPQKEEIMLIWDNWIATNPEEPFYLGWSEYAEQFDDSESLFTEKRVYIKKVSNELRELEVPKTMWQKVAKALAAVASMFLVIFLALSRLSRATE